VKLSFGKRIILFFHWLISVFFLVSALFPGISAQAGSFVVDLFGQTTSEILLILFAAVYVILCVAAIWIICTGRAKRSERGLITVDSAESGVVRISVHAVEQMVKQAVTTVDGIAEMKIGVASEDDAIAISVNITLISGSHVPTVTLNMQRAIRQFVEMNCGVAVHSVSISIQAVVSADEASRKGKYSDVKAASPEAVLVPTEKVLPAQDMAEDFTEVPVLEPVSTAMIETDCDESAEDAPSYDESDVPEKDCSSIEDAARVDADEKPSESNEEQQN